MATQKEEIVVRAGFDNTALASGLRQTESMVQGFATRIGGLMAGAFSIGALAEFDKTLVEWAKNLSETATRLAVTTDEVQQLSFAADQTGVSLDKVAAAFDRLAKAKEQGLGHVGSGTSAEMALSKKAFAEFGISPSDMGSSSPKELFDQIAESIRKTGVNSEVTANLMQLMGRNAGSLIPMLKELKDLEPQADVLPAAAVKDLETQGRFMDRMWTRLKVMAGTLASPSSYRGLFSTPSAADMKRRDDALSAEAEKKGELNFLQQSYDSQEAALQIQVEELHVKKDIGKEEDEMLKTREKYLEKLQESADLQKSIGELVKRQAQIKREQAAEDSAGTYLTLEQLSGRSYIRKIDRQYGAGGIFDLARGNTSYRNAARELYRLTNGATQFDREHGGNVAWDIDRIKQLRSTLSQPGGPMEANASLATIADKTTQTALDIAALLAHANAKGIPVQIPSQ